jgi:hypothetical protein
MITTKKITSTLSLGDKVKKDDMVTIEGTGVTEFLPYRHKTTVHRLAAQTLIKAGKAVAV